MIVCRKPLFNLKMFVKFADFFFLVDSCRNLACFCFFFRVSHVLFVFLSNFMAVDLSKV